MLLGPALGLSAILFSLGVAGVLLRRNAIILFMCVELMLNAVNLSFVAFSRLYGTAGQVFVVFVMTVLQAWILRRELHGRLEAAETLRAIAAMLVAAAALCAVAYAVWWSLDDLLGRSLPAQVVSVGLGVTTGLAVYGWLALALRVPEARRIARMVRERF